MLTKQDFIEALPSKVSKGINAAVVSHVNDIIKDQDSRERFRENLLNYNKILQEGKYRVTDYISAIMYVGFKAMNHQNIDAFALTFPEKMKKYAKEGKTTKELHNIVAAYNRSKLVVTLTAQTIIPTHILNQDLYQESLNVNAKLMRTASSEIVRQKAAEFLASHLAPPVEAKVKLEIGAGEDFLHNMREATAEMAKQQMLTIANGHATAAQIAKQKLFEESVVEVIE